MSFLLAGSEVAPHSPGSGRAFSFTHRLSHRAAHLLCAFALCIPLAPAAAAPFAYVPNEGSGSISIIDTATDRVVGEIPTGGQPRGIAAGVDVIYVSDQPASALKAIDISTWQMGARARCQ